MADIAAYHYSKNKYCIDQYKLEVDDYLESLKNKAFTNLAEVDGYIKKGNELIGKIKMLIEGLDHQAKTKHEWDKRKEDIESAIEKLKNQKSAKDSRRVNKSEISLGVKT